MLAASPMRAADASATSSLLTPRADTGKVSVVRVDRRFTHPIYKKTIRRSKNYHAHDENNEFKPGDMVWIEESKPISKLKRWTVVRGEQKKTA